MEKARIATIFVLLALLVLTALAVLGANLNFFGAATRDSAFAKWGITGVLAEIVALCWFLVKFLFKESRLALLVCLPSELAAQEIRLIEWDEDECFILGAKLREKVKLIPSPVGPSLRVHFPPRILDLLKDEEFLELQLRDMNGNRWEVKRFYPFENVHTLLPVGQHKHLVQDYPGAAYE